MRLLRVNLCRLLTPGVHSLITPFILAVINSTNLGSDACFDLMRIALDETTVEIALRPAARIVSPDSTRSTMPSATPSAHAASTLPPTYLMTVFNLAFAPPQSMQGLLLQPFHPTISLAMPYIIQERILVLTNVRVHPAKYLLAEQIVRALV